MNVESAKQSRQWLNEWPMMLSVSTPLWNLPDLAQRLGVGELRLKDESKRSTLNSFKALGAPIALVRLVARRIPGIEPTEVLRGSSADILRDLVVISATDGNHGRALAAAAQSSGVRCVIVLHKNVCIEREQAIAEFGAEIIRIDGSYDESVNEAARLAVLNGWEVISDTSYEGYETVPRDVMQGYGTIPDELVECCNGGSDEKSLQFTHVFLQGGVGGMAAGIVSYLHEVMGADRPTIVIVEPDQADCLMQSALQGKPAAATGSVDSLMAGLACGETSPLAWRFLETTADFFITVSDQEAKDAMCTLAHGSAQDLPIVSGESGAAGLAGLVSVAADDAARAQIGLDGHSSVLLISTEGATAPMVYRACVGQSADSVLQAQASWLRQHAAYL